MKKKVLTAVLAAAMVMSMAGCGSTKDTTSTAGNTASTDAQTESAAETTDGTEAASGATYKVGIVQYVDDASLNQIEAAIEAELDKKGEELGVTFDYGDYTFNGQADSTTLNQIATELVADNVDVIIPIATPAAMIMQNATEDNQIPVVFSAVSDPVAAGLVKSMDKPGSNITGVSDALNTDAFMKMITTAKTVKKIGFLNHVFTDSIKLNPCQAFLGEAKTCP